MVLLLSLNHFNKEVAAALCSVDIRKKTNLSIWERIQLIHATDLHVHPNIQKHVKYDAYSATLLLYCLCLISAIWNNSHFISIFKDAEIFRGAM